ncbi:hypothetical protein GJ629_00365 [Halapricum sp. CBA1109]|uniref:hypothetical protein n=1 Tax=Halapricum sp. CBA1109 TaxID=2668068 RepID=UPI0012FB4AA1|nr:hypothetical protein [Halapricum sp. CBA1109]MUV88526.1 hypothetical protein [Halapricum sp. CBA1109]
MQQFGRRLRKATGFGVGSFALFGLVTGLIPNPVYVRMVPRTGLDYAFLLLTAGFLGLYTVQRAPGGTGADTTAGASTVLGFLAFGCPVCNAVLLTLFGSSALMTYFDPLRPLFGVVSVALFGGLLYVRRQRPCEQCVDGEPTGTTPE